MEEIVIVAASRTAVGKFGGSLAKIAAPDLGAVVIKDLLARTGLSADQIGDGAERDAGRVSARSCGIAGLRDGISGACRACC